MSAASYPLRLTPAMRTWLRKEAKRRDISVNRLIRGMILGQMGAKA
jgi:predicted HicB family RNase H-like nuclease